MKFIKLILILLLVCHLTACSDPRITVDPNTKNAIVQHLNNHVIPKYF